MHHQLLKTLFFGILLLSSACFEWSNLWAENCPVGYYDRIEGASDSILKGRLKAIIRNHTVIDYGTGSWEVFYYADRDENGDCMDMYCDNWQKFGSPGSAVSGCNVEHSFAKSWWGGAKNDAYKDCYHLNPSNSTANGSRSNYPPGIPLKDFKEKAGTGSLLVGKRHHDALGEDYFVFEPKDEYKGDFARAYFYMATCYGRDSLGNYDKTICSDYKGWRLDNKDVGSRYGMQNNDYFEFQPWLVEVLLDWHRKDPVSKKELKRMDAVSDFQHNRNPFIEYPCLAEYIWGNRKGQKVQLSSLKRTTDGDWLSITDSLRLTGCSCDYTEPTLATSTNQINFPSLLLDQDTAQQFHAIYALLPEDATISIVGEDSAMFTIDQTLIPATERTYVDTTLRVHYHPTSIGEHTATVVIACPGVDTLTIALQGTCTYLCQVSWLVNSHPTTAGDPTTEVVRGQRITMMPTAPASPSATSETYMGWTSAPIPTPVDQAPADLFTTAESAPAIEEDQTFYAVFAHHTQTGSGTDVTQTAEPGTSTGWTIYATEKSSAAGKYWLLTQGSSISSPVIDLSTLKSVAISIRTFGGASYKTVDINAQDQVLGSLSGTSSTIHSYTWTNAQRLTGSCRLVFNSATSSGDYGPGVASVAITTSGLRHTYSAYITEVGEVTGMSETPENPVTNQKVLRNGRLYIIHNNRLYDAQGALLK